MPKQSKSSNYFIWIQKKRLKMRNTAVQKVTRIKFVNILSSLKCGWKKLYKNDLFSDFDDMSSVFTGIKKSLAILILLVLFLGSIIVIFFVGRWSSYPEEMRKNRPTPFELHLLANYTENTYNEKLVSSIEKSSRAGAQDVLSNLTMTVLGVIIAMFAFIVVFLVVMFQLLWNSIEQRIDSRLPGQINQTTATPTQGNHAITNGGSTSSQGGMCEYCFRLRAPVTTTSVSTAPVTTASVSVAPVTTASVSVAPVTTASVSVAPVTTTSVISAPITTTVSTAPVLAQTAVINPTLPQTNQENANSSPSSQGVTCSCCVFCQRTAPITTDPIVTFNAGTEGVILQD